MSKHAEAIDGFVIYDLEAEVPTAANAAAGGMRIGTVILAIDTGFVRRLVDSAGLVEYQGLTGEKLSGIATIPMGASTVDVTVAGMTATGVVLVSLWGAAFDGTIIRVIAHADTGKFTIVANGNAAADAKVAWLVTKLS